MVKLGIVALANNSGLGNQTRRLTYMLKPYRLLVVDSRGFSKNKKQHFDWYNDFEGYRVDGFPSDHEVKVFLKGLTHVLVCENPLNNSFTRIAKQMGVKVFIQENWEFNDYLIHNLELPEKFLVPSYWKLQEMIELFGENKCIYLPPPIDPDEFKNARDENINSHGKRYLHIVGTLATSDRNGTLDLLEAVKVSKGDYSLTIRSQRPLESEYILNDPRIKYEFEDLENQEDLYKGFDAMILPRRYGGLCLPMGEALMSAMPVIMTDIEPNNGYLPNEWLVRATLGGQIMTRTMIDVYKSDIYELAGLLDSFESSLDEKKRAFERGVLNFSPEVLRGAYQRLWT